MRAVKVVVSVAAFCGASIAMVASASALSAMPMANGDPYPTIVTLCAVFMSLVFAFIAVDRLEQRQVERMRKDNDVTGLIGALKNGWLSRKAACALGDMKAGDAVEPLVAALGDENSDLRQAAAKALGDIGDSRALEPLERALGDEYFGVRECARYAIKRIQKPGNAL